MIKSKMKAFSWLQNFRMFAALLLSMTLVACNSNDDPIDVNVTNISVGASAAQEIPTNASSATAKGSLSVNTMTGALSGSVVATGMTVSVAHIHEGKAGSNGSSVIPLDVSGNTVSVPAGTVLTSTQITSMLSGDFYVNLHSATYPSGEIRGQIAPSGVEVLTFELKGANAVPPLANTGSGKAYVTLNRTSSLLSINIATTTNTVPTAAHIHGGFAGETGSSLMTLVQDTADTSMFSLSGSVEQSVIDAIDAGGAYLNVHTPDNPSGELRAQILPAGVTVHSAMLSGDQEVPAVTTTGSGMGSLTLNSNASLATVIVSTTNVDDATKAHVHTGMAGANGGSIFGLTQDATDLGLWVARDVSVDAAIISSITAGNTYFNVHTPANTGGEIRGQIPGN